MDATVSLRKADSRMSALALEMEKVGHEAMDASFEEGCVFTKEEQREKGEPEFTRDMFGIHGIEFESAPSRANKQ